jgi:flagellar biosynthesis regulator FlbT
MNEETKRILIEAHKALKVYRALLTNEDEQLNADEVLTDIELRFIAANIKLSY